jgi:hypothetical protein
MEKYLFFMGKSTISMTIFHSKLFVYQRLHHCSPGLNVGVVRPRGVGIAAVPPRHGGPWLTPKKPFGYIYVKIAIENGH